MQRSELKVLVQRIAEMQAAVESLHKLAGQQVFVNYVRPFCDKHRVAYRTCNGSFWFVALVTGRRFYLDECKLAGAKVLDEALNMEVSSRNCVFEYVPNYPEVK